MAVFTKSEQLDFNATERVTVKHEKEDEYEAMDTIGQGNEEHIFTEDCKISIDEEFVKIEHDPLSPDTAYSNNDDDTKLRNIYTENDNSLRNIRIKKYPTELNESYNVHKNNKSEPEQQNNSLRNMRINKCPISSDSVEENSVEELLFKSEPEEEANQDSETSESDSNEDINDSPSEAAKWVEEDKLNEDNNDDRLLQDAKIDKYLKMWKVLYPEVDVQEQKKIYQENKGCVRQTMDKMRLLNEERNKKKVPVIHAKRPKKIKTAIKSYPLVDDEEQMSIYMENKSNIEETVFSLQHLNDERKKSISPEPEKQNDSAGDVLNCSQVSRKESEDSSSNTENDTPANTHQAIKENASKKGAGHKSTKPKACYGQDELNERKGVLYLEVNDLLLRSNQGLLNLEDKKILKQKETELNNLTKKLSSIQALIRQQKSGTKRKQDWEVDMEEDHELEKISKVRKIMGKPTLEENQDGLLEAIVELATYGYAVEDKQRTNKLRTKKTLDEMKSELGNMGYELSRSALCTCCIPKNSNTLERRLHVKSVPVKLIKTQNDQHTIHPDTEFCTASINALKIVASILGKEEVSFISQDTKARVPIGVTAANKQAPLMMHVEYNVKLPDHEFVKAPGHKLIPDVYAGIDLKSSNEMCNPKSIGYSGPTYIAIRSAKHSKSTSYVHLEDIKMLSTIPEFDDIMLTSDHLHKPVRIILCDGGPDESPRYQKTIECGIDQFLAHDLDALFIATNAPGRSAFNCVERRMAPLSRELSGVLLPHDYFGSHLDSQGQTIDEALEAENFQNSGKVLGEIWSDMVIDGYPVKAEFIKPTESVMGLEKVSIEWRNIHVRESQYMLQIVKCNNIECCSPRRSSFFTFNEKMFLPAPLPLKQTKQKGLTVSINDPDTQYPSLLLIKLLNKNILPRSAAKFKNDLPYDYACPSLQDILSSRTCNVCGMYMASIKSLKIHKKSCIGNGREGRSDRAVRDCVCPIRVAAKRQQELMCVVRYMEMEELEWHDEEDVQFKKNSPQHSSVESGTPIISIQDMTQASWKDA